MGHCCQRCGSGFSKRVISRPRGHVSARWHLSTRTIRILGNNIFATHMKTFRKPTETILQCGSRGHLRAQGHVSIRTTRIVGNNIFATRTRASLSPKTYLSPNDPNLAKQYFENPHDGILQPDTGQPLEHDGTVFRSAAHPALGREAVTCREAPGSRHASCLGDRCYARPPLS